MSHSEWVQRLVSKLVFDPGHADDVVQETWRVAIERPPGEASDPKGWLAKVARNASRNLGRGEGRRRQRERVAARADTAPDTLDVVSKAELQKRLVQAVLHLREPYRTPVLLRFFEGLPAREIAAQLDRSTTTVHSQIHRGLTELRADLDAEYGDRTAWVVAFLPLARGVVGQSAGTGVQLSFATAAWKWVAAALLLVAGLSIARPWWSSTDLDEFDSAHAVADTPRGSSERELNRLAAVAPRTDREAAAPPTAAPTPRLRVELIDPATGTPVAGVPWWIVRTGTFDPGLKDGKRLPHTPLHQGVTAGDGSLSFPLPKDAIVQLRTERTEEFAQGSWALATRDEEPRDLTLPLSRGRTVTGRVIDTHGQPLSGVEIARCRFDASWEPIGTTDEEGRFVVARMAQIPTRFVLDRLDKIIPTKHESERVRLRQDALPLPPRVRWGRIRHWDVDPSGPGAGPLDLGDIRAERTRHLTGTVVDENGHPIEGALVSYLLCRVKPVLGEYYGGTPPPLPWERHGQLDTGEVLSDERGHFSLSIKLYDENESRIVAVCPEGRHAAADRPPLKPGKPWPELLLKAELKPTMKLKLIDAEQPDRGLWSWPGEPPTVQVQRHTQGLFPSGHTTSLRADDQGVVLLQRHFLTHEHTSLSLMMEGYEPHHVELDRSGATQIIELTRQAQVQVEVTVSGPGAALAPTMNIMVSSLGPLTEEEAKSRYLGTAGSRSTDNDFSLYDYTANGLATGESTTLPRPSTEYVWVYVELPAPAGYSPLPPVPFGPFPKTQTTVHCAVEVPEWSVPGASAADGLAGLLDDRNRLVRMRIIAASTGEAIDGAELEFFTRNKWYHGIDESKDGLIEVSLPERGYQYRITHDEFHPEYLGRLAMDAGGTLDLGEVALNPLRTLPGQLLDHTGAPLREERWIWWIDPELGLVYEKTDEDGSFLLGVTEGPPDPINVRHPDGPRHLGAQCRLVPVEGQDTYTCRVPRSSPVRFEVSGVPLAAAAAFAPVFVEREDGVRNKLWRTAGKADCVLYTECLAPGRYTLHGGWIVDFPPHPFEVPAGGEPMVVKIAGRATVQ